MFWSLGGLHSNVKHQSDGSKQLKMENFVIFLLEKPRKTAKTENAVYSGLWVVYRLVPVVFGFTDPKLTLE